MATPEHYARPGEPSSGLTLVELLIALTIIGILAAIAYPSYLDQVRKSRRAVAKSALLDAANREEQYFFSKRSYASLTDLGYTTTYFGKDGSPTSEADAVYQLSAMTVNESPGTCGTALPPCFQLSATPWHDQINDACNTFTLASDNVRDVSGGSASASECW